MHNLLRATIVFLGILLAVPHIAWAQVVGDPAALVEAANSLDANLAKITSWRGEVQYLMEASIPDAVKAVAPKQAGGTALIECKILFFVDTTNNMSRVDIDVVRDDLVKDGKTEPRMALDHISYLMLDDAFYDLRYPKGAVGKRTAYVRDKPYYRPGYSHRGFDPFFYYSNGGPSFSQFWRSFARNPLDPNVKGFAVAQTDDRVTLTSMQDRPGGKIETVTEIDKRFAGNVTSYKLSTNSPLAQSSGNHIWKWTRVAGIVVPASYEHDLGSTGPGATKHHVKVVWKEHVVNEPIARAEFSLEKLGLRPDDKLDDTRTSRDQLNAIQKYEELTKLNSSQILKHISTPFPEYRAIALRAMRANSKARIDDSQYIFRDNHNAHINFKGGGHAGPGNLPMVVRYLADIGASRIEGDKKLLTVPVTGDWIVRGGTSTDKLLPEIEKALKQDCNLSVSLQLKEELRTVLVVSGELKLAPADGGDVAATKPRERSIKGSGSFQSFLNGLEYKLGCIAINEATAPWRQRFSWKMSQHPIPLDQLKPADWEKLHGDVLQPLTQQTGLQFAKETRKVQILHVTRDEPQK